MSPPPLPMNKQFEGGLAKFIKFFLKGFCFACLDIFGRNNTYTLKENIVN